MFTLAPHDSPQDESAVADMTMLLCVGEILERVCRRRMEEILDMTRRAQRKALARTFAFGLLRPFSGMNVSVRLGEIAHNILSQLANSSSTIQTDCALLLSHNV